MQRNVLRVSTLLIDTPPCTPTTVDPRGRRECENTFQSITVYAHLLGAARCSAEGRLIWNYRSVPPN